MTTGTFLWSTTAGSNASADSSINWAEGQAPSSVNDSARALMARIAEYRKDHAGTLVTSTSATAYTLTTNQVFNSLANMDGNKLRVKFKATNGAAPTLAVDGLAAKALQLYSGTAIPTGMILENSIWDVTYDNTASAWIISGLPAVAPATTFSSISVSTGNLDISGGGITLISTGTAALPGLAFHNDPNTGWESPAANQIGGAVNGIETFNLSTSGLSITGSGTFSSGLTVSAGSVSLPAGSVQNAALASSAAAFSTQLYHLRDVKAQGTAAQSLTTTTWNKRDLNTEVTAEITSASVSSSVISLPAGTYFINGRTRGQTNAGVTMNKLRFRNTTDGADLIVGQSCADSGSQTVTDCFIQGRFTIAGTKSIELQHYTNGTSIVGGIADNLAGYSEIYTELMIWKVA